jgi:DNA-binding protein HU-beta
VKVKRPELVARMAKAAGWPKTRTDRAFRAMLAAMVRALARGESVTLVGLGTFLAPRRKPRVIRLPRSTRHVTVAGRRLRFRPSPMLKRAVLEALGRPAR